MSLVSFEKDDIAFRRAGPRGILPQASSSSNLQEETVPRLDELDDFLIVAPLTCVWYCESSSIVIGLLVESPAICKRRMLEELDPKSQIEGYIVSTP